MKGGAFDPAKPGTYVRQFGAFKQRLYKLIYSQDDTNNTYTLDFTQAGFTTGILAPFLTSDKYIEMLTNGLKVSSAEDKHLIKYIITNLFDGGLDGVKSRKLELTQPISGGDIRIRVLDSSGSLFGDPVTIRSAQNKAEQIFIDIKDGINPV
jgi:hypothetical protein